MDKQNYIIKGINKQDIEKNFSELKERIVDALKKARVIQRRRIVWDYEILIQAAYLYIIKKLSFQRLSDTMSVNYHVTMSDTSWKKQLRKVAPVFLDTVLLYLQEKAAEESERKQTRPEQKTYAIDATNVAQEGKENILMRVHTQLCLDCHAEVNVTITDNHTSENVQHLPVLENTLYIADRAYGKAKQLAFLCEQKADFIFRISPSQIKLHADAKCSKPLDYDELLSEDSFDCWAYFSCYKKVYSVRVVGEKLPEEKQAQAEKRVRRKSSKNGSKVQSKTLEYAKWLILVTSLNGNAAEIVDLYLERWQIELFFKRAKSLFGLKKSDFPRKITEKCLFSYGSA